MTISHKIRLFQVVGQRKPSDADPNPTVFRMRIFANNKVVARSRFWYFMSLHKKLKKANGNILETREIFEKHPETVNNYGIWVRYDSRTETMNMYKEYRDTSLCNAVARMYQEMAGRHRARFSSINVVKTAILDSKDCKRQHVTLMHDSKLRFPTPHRVIRAPSKKFRGTFKATRSSTH